MALIGAAGAATLIFANGSKPIPPKESSEPVNPKLVTADTAFGIGLFQQLVKHDAGKNVFISPASVSLALSMTYNGASGTTKDAMAKTLGLAGMSLEDVNKANSALLANLQGPGPGVELKIADSLWARDGVLFEKDFMSRNREFYHAEITNLDFDKPDAAGVIDAWVRKKTNGKIDKIVGQISPLAILYLINAVYFKGEWQDKFDEKLTHDGEFTIPDGSKKTVKMMKQNGEYRYMEEPGFQAVSLPYGKGRMSMYVFLPSKDSGLSEFMKTLTPENWTNRMHSFATREGEIKLPKFKIEYEATLNDALKSMGMGVAFSQDQADFSAMTPIRPVWISSVKHKTFVEVNEKGTEAAAVTSVTIRATAMPPSARFKMIVDRPFALAISDNQTGALLFLGAITDPGK